MAIGFIGYGRFGRALSALFLERGNDVRAYDPEAQVPSGLRAASIAELARDADVVIVAVPVPKTRAALEALAPHVREGALVMDVGSVKLHPSEAMREVLGAKIAWVATHPLFGPTSLALGERPLRVVVCPNEAHPRVAARARSLYESIGCVVIEEDAEVHDRAMADTHALAFFVAKGLLDAGAGQDAPFTPPSFHAIARVIETVRSDAGHLFSAIQRENPFAPAARRRLIDALVAADRAMDEELGTAPLTIPDLGAQSPELRETRELIDELDRDLVTLLARRAELAARAAKSKATLGRGVRDAAREASLLDARRAWASEQGLDPGSVAEIFEAILRFSRRVQRA